MTHLMQKEISKIISPGKRGRGLGGKKKKWPLSKESEYFARVRSMVIKGLSVRSAAIKLSKEAGEDKDVIQRKYRSRFSKLTGLLPVDVIDEAVRCSLK